MSMALCSECGMLVDTDDDPECFIDMVKRDRVTTIVLCGECRITLEMENEDAYE